MILKDCEALDSLEYFERDRAGKLRLARGVADGIIDFHAHIGWQYLLGRPVDQDRLTAEVKTFFPMRGNPLDLDHYSSLSFTKESARKTSWETIKPVWSTQGFTSTHTGRNLVDEMDRMGIERAVLLAIDWPLGHFSRNSEVVLAASHSQPRFVPFVSVHPFQPFCEKRVRRLSEAGAKGMKIHPPMQLVRPDNTRAIRLAQICGNLGLPCLYHSGHSDISPPWLASLPAIRHFRKPIEELPGTTFIMGHSGIHMYREAIELAGRYPNVYLELSGQPPARIREMMDVLGPDRLLFGSDWPYYPVAMPLAKVLLATEGMPEARRKILRENALALFNHFGIL